MSLKTRFTACTMIAVLFLCLGNVDGQTVTFEWADIGDPGNLPDPDTGFGAVDDAYRIAKHEVTYDQYVEFLNSTAAADPNSCYDPSMFVTRTGSSGSYVYSTVAGYGSRPINYVTIFNAMRFVNWLENGQPTGSQEDTTEEGAYTIGNTNGGTSVTQTRTPGATFFIPSEHEWYKAAYFDPRSEAAGGAPGDDNYWLYPTQSDANPMAEIPPGGFNSANFDFVVQDSNDVGAYVNSTSFYGTFDQGGNLFEYNDTVIPGTFPGYGARGGSFLIGVTAMRSTNPNRGGGPASRSWTVGFRVASVVAEPTVEVTPSDFAVTRGALSAGGLSELADSDNMDLSARRSTADIQSRVYLEVTSTSPTLTPSHLEFSLEASVFARTQVIQTIELFDYVAGAFEEIDVRAANRFSDLTVVASPMGDVSRFVSQTDGEISARVRFDSINPRQAFTANIDQTLWTITP